MKDDLTYPSSKFSHNLATNRNKRFLISFLLIYILIFLLIAGLKFGNPFALSISNESGGDTFALDILDQNATIRYRNQSLLVKYVFHVNVESALVAARIYNLTDSINNDIVNGTVENPIMSIGNNIVIVVFKYRDLSIFNSMEYSIILYWIVLPNGYERLIESSLTRADIELE